MSITETEILTVLHAIEVGQITLTPTLDPQMVWAGDVTYQASNGWVLVVFIDCGEWDYLDSVKTRDKREMTFDELEALPRIANYKPSEDIAWQQYGMPGYMTSRH